MKKIHSTYRGYMIWREPNYVDCYQHYNYYTDGKTFRSLQDAKDYIRNKLADKKK